MAKFELYSDKRGEFPVAIPGVERTGHGERARRRLGQGAENGR